MSIEEAGFRFYSDAGILMRKAIGEVIFDQAVKTSGKRDLNTRVLSWLSKAGPFWISEQSHSVGDLFACMDDDVTGSAIAEAACRHSPETPCELFGFAPSKYTRTPLPVVWTRNTGGEVDISIGNFWELPVLKEYLAALTPICNWDSLLNWAKQKCEHLLFSEDVIIPILNEPFSYSAAQDIQMLLLILDDFSKSHDASGALNSHGLELHKIHFQGKHTRFSSETPNTKFNFIHPITKSQVQCSWHGKVRLDLQYRIHFQWPKPRDMNLWIAYIGPKLTKW